MIEHGPCDPGNPPAARLWAGGRIPTIACGMIGAWPTRVKEWLTGRLSRSGQHSWGPQRAKCGAGHLLRNRGWARLGGPQCAKCCAGHPLLNRDLAGPIPMRGARPVPRTSDRPPMGGNRLARAGEVLGAATAAASCLKSSSTRSGKSLDGGQTGQHWARPRGSDRCSGRAHSRQGMPWHPEGKRQGMPWHPEEAGRNGLSRRGASRGLESSGRAVPAARSSAIRRPTVGSLARDRS